MVTLACVNAYLAVRYRAGRNKPKGVWTDMNTEGTLPALVPPGRASGTCKCHQPPATNGNPFRAMLDSDPAERDAATSGRDLLELHAIRKIV